MRGLGAMCALALVAAIVGCDSGASADPSDMPLPGHDMQPDPMPDAEAGMVDMRPRDAAVDMDAAEPEDMAPDMPPPPDSGVCPALDGVIPGDLPLVDRAWRLELPPARAAGRLSPSCGEGVSASAGDELIVRLRPEVTGDHLVVIAGRYSALYLSTPCSPDRMPELGNCLVIPTPFEEGATRARRLELAAGEEKDVVVDAPAGAQAGPLVVLVYPPVSEGGSCAPVEDTVVAPSCAPGTACIDGVCTWNGPPAVEMARAWTDGQSLRLEATLRGVDLVQAVWARTQGSGYVQLQPTGLEEAPTRLAYEGFVEDAALAGAERVDLEIVDAEGRTGQRVVAVQRLMPLNDGAACDPDGLRDVCAPGGDCIDGRCRPTLVGAWIGEDGLNVQVAMPDGPAGHPLLRAVVRSWSAPAGTRWQALPDLPAEVGLRWADVGLDAGFADMMMRIQEPGRPPGLPVALEFERLPVRGEGEACDAERISDDCERTLACRAEADGAVCVAVDPPRITSAQAFYGAEAMGLKVAYVDPQDDAAAFDFVVTDEEGEVRFRPPTPVPLPADADGLVLHSFPADWDPGRGDVVDVTVIDAEGLESEAVRARLLPAPIAPVGAQCDPLGALAVCVGNGLICAAVESGGDPMCVPFDEPCPEEWRPFPLVAPTRHEDNHRNGPDRTGGECGGEGTPEAIYELTPENDARWHVSVQPAGSAVYVRTHCRFAVPDVSELICRMGAFDLDVEGGETYYLFVDGPGQGGRFTLSIEEELAPVEPDPGNGRR